jgi:phage-related tail fiber protein
MKLTSSTSCTGGCGFGESLTLTVTFGTPISVFNLSMYYIFTPGVDAGGNFSVYINNTNPASDPVTGLVPFKETLRTGGWWQRTLSYLGDHDVNTITLVFYDLTDTVEFDTDQLKINYR